ncbi:DegV family protein [Haloimpatiens lingqiaonensis]|uniref:DegV family protein n=1 Tax=Haloimpatiens lingqiaonensis TaxID=1380675 RepID=UPI0010FE2528|nr:DegV family protein [Haloimpatiens lingqiaonensis]
MEKIKIITDSTADLPKHIVDKYGIEVLPLFVNFGEESFRDGVDIHLEEFLERMYTSDMFPTTTQVNPQRFYECYKKYIEEGYKIISIHLSSKMSGTYQSAKMAVEMLISDSLLKNPDDIVVIDSLNVTSGLGILVIESCKLRDEGKTIKEIQQGIIERIPHVKSCLAFSSLDNLVKGGRLSKTAGMIGNILGIKLILEVKDGEMAVMDKLRGGKKAVKKIISYMDEKGIKQGATSILLNADNKDILEDLKTKVDSLDREFVEAHVGCIVGTHSGGGACGVFFIEEY